MIKHKKKDPMHAYCSKCNVDCENDMNFMIHQIESSKHSRLTARARNELLTMLLVCCPVCGMEVSPTCPLATYHHLTVAKFKSTGGRDRHVEIVGSTPVLILSVLTTFRAMQVTSASPAEAVRLSSLELQHL